MELEQPLSLRQIVTKNTRAVDLSKLPWRSDADDKVLDDYLDKADIKNVSGWNEVSRQAMTDLVDMSDEKLIRKVESHLKKFGLDDNFCSGFLLGRKGLPKKEPFEGDGVCSDLIFVGPDTELDTYSWGQMYPVDRDRRGHTLLWAKIAIMNTKNTNKRERNRQADSKRSNKRDRSSSRREKSPREEQRRRKSEDRGVVQEVSPRDDRKRQSNSDEGKRDRNSRQERSPKKEQRRRHSEDKGNQRYNDQGDRYSPRRRSSSREDKKRSSNSDEGKRDRDRDKSPRKEQRRKYSDERDTSRRRSSSREDKKRNSDSDDERRNRETKESGRDLDEFGILSDADVTSDKDSSDKEQLNRSYRKYKDTKRSSRRGRDSR